MTVLYHLRADAAAIGEQFDCWTGDDPWLGGYVAAGKFAPVITTGREFIAGPRSERGPRRMIPRIWGVPPPPNAHDPARGILTVRNLESPFWIGNLRNPEFRCLVPATGFAEWGQGTDKEGRRVQHLLACSDQPLYAFAGVWVDSEVPTFAILSCSANAALTALGRDTMPVILPPGRAAQDVWLHGSWDRAQDLVAPYSSSMMRDVSDRGDAD